MENDQSGCKSLQRPLKIALIGYGKMGKAVEAAAIARGHSIVSIVSPSLPMNKITEKSLSQVDLCIDFSHPAAVIDNIRQISEHGKNIVVGTTGWHDRLDEVQQIVDKNHVGLIYAANFSIGVNIFYRIAAQAAQLIDHFDEYDAAVSEVHHTQKFDAPSGTGLRLAHILLEKLKRKTRICHADENHPNQPFGLQISSQRCGYNPGSHTVTFDSPADIITLNHQARNREGFAKGAVRAAEWVMGKQGVHTLDDMILTMVQGHKL